MAESPASIKSMAFAARIVRMSRYLERAKKEYDISRQVLRSGTSIGANIAEARSSITKKEFLSKIFISLKECRETAYWLNLLHETDYLTDEQFRSINADCSELYLILSAIARTTTKNLALQEKNRKTKQ
ncbi:MAG: four helix bundle protein [Muribaculaceae bacterium]|nr:four helix bundle protein [Muribaculaceae bacterium]